jgi:hypothetical protein
LSFTSRSGGGATTTIVTICSAVAPRELVTVFLIWVDPTSKMYALEPERAISWLFETRYVLMEDERLPSTGSEAVGAYLPATLVPR